MKCILTLDVNNGMTFNHRRLSRDKQVILDMLEVTKGSKLYASNYSASLFDNTDPVTYYENPFISAGSATYVYSELINPLRYIEQIDEFVIYQWNKEYPSDVRFAVDLRELGFSIINRVLIPTKTHPGLERIVYSRYVL